MDGLGRHDGRYLPAPAPSMKYDEEIHPSLKEVPVNSASVTPSNGYSTLRYIFELNQFLLEFPIGFSFILK